MRTTDKNHPVWKYMLNAINDNLKEEYGLDKEPETDQEKVQFVLDTFKSEYGFNVSKYGLQGAFKEWLMGLPSVFNIDFENYKIIEIAKKWGSIPENATEKQEDKIIENWFNFIACKFFQLCRKLKVQ
jgi:hypothetical protein